MGPPGSVDAGSVTGPLYWTATGGTVPRSAQDRSADVINALDHGADPTGVADSSAAFNAALAVRRNGRPVDVFAPAGAYLLNSPIAVGDSVYSQRLFGAGWSTVLIVGPGFSSSALGVILINPAAYNYEARAQASVCDLQILFQQPPDFSTTATGGTGVGGTTVTVASVSGAHVGSYCVDSTNSGALPGGAITPKVTGIAGNVVTLDRPTVGVISVGDVILFAGNRSQAVTLSPTPSLVPGSPAIKYPWAIYTPLSQSIFIDHVLVSAAWNGIYIRGSSFVIGQYFVGCLNVGLDIDQCNNFPKIDHFMFWGWGIPYAMSGVYYDGQTIAANIGACDGLDCDSLQSWTGIVNLTPNWSWGSFTKLGMDGDNANLNILSTNAGGWVQIGKLYKTGGRNSTNGVPFVVNSPLTVSIDDILLSVAPNSPGITLATGVLRIAGGSMWNGVGNGYPMIQVTSGALSMDQMRLDAAASKTDAYLVQTGGSVRVSNSAFLTPPVAGTRAFVLTASPRNSIANVDLNGWDGTLPPTTLPRVAISTSYTNDAAAAAGGVEIGQEYRNGSIRMVRVA
jgi:hypothetical protein